jgi:hypothetical protein
MGQAIDDIRHMLHLAETLRRDAKRTDRTPYSDKLLIAAMDLEKQAEFLSKRQGYTLI